MSDKPFPAADIRGVLPLADARFVSTPAASRASTASRLFLRTA
eukprot:CAMPEP_0175707080 /NCGR_PEP_ID=MMETSP0097-20121207/38375_1 /TAXON_ID=311494 /ORGANISM="Alexandrium monilatum, Strain CCMP3105" /LENGTH=42 /DNA_ID= /DNA_START= /DNA_END= /DNA_ORIENTATION=